MRIVLCTLLLAALVGLCCGCVTPYRSPSSDVIRHNRVTRSVSTSDRENCGDRDTQPPTRIDTTSRLSRLRGLFKATKFTRGNLISAYIIPSEDAHQSEYIPDCDKRRAYISGLSGSAGTAVVTRDKAAIWTDGRYFIQAEEELDCNWILMKDGEKGVPTILEWLTKVLQPKDLIGVDPAMMAASQWLTWSAELEEHGITMVPIKEYNLVDQIWDDKPVCSRDKVFIQPIEFAGKSWQEKVDEVREKMQDEGADAMVITAMDEVAWLLNLRGNDVPHNPVFKSYLLLDMSSITLLIPLDKVNTAVKKHLNTQECTYSSSRKHCVELADYKMILRKLKERQANWDKVLLPSKYSYSGGASFAIYTEIDPVEKIIMGPSPVLFLKGRKNKVEIAGMIRAHVKDSVALISFAAKLQPQIEDGVYWDEITAADELEKHRAEQKDFMGTSFGTISGYGSNGAIIHYTANNNTKKQIKRDALYLLDSGGQYRDGTTDVTRTFHYGRPTEYEREMYTRVLMGAIDLAMTVIPEGTKDTRIDINARGPLFAVGKNYRHGTGHGIGAFLNIHESPTQLRYYQDEEHELQEGNFFSDEPGYYEEGKFGIRLETIVRMVKANKTEYGQFLRIEAVALVPFEPKLIMTEIMSVAQRKWLNDYNRKVRSVVGEELKKQGKMEGFHWMMERTGHVSEGCASSANTMLSSVIVMLTSVILLWH